MTKGCTMSYEKYHSKYHDQIINKFIVTESSRNIFAQIKNLRDLDLVKHASKDFQIFIQSHVVQVFCENSSPEVKEEAYKRKKKAKCYNELDPAKFRDEQDIKSIFDNPI